MPHHGRDTSLRYIKKIDPFIRYKFRIRNMILFVELFKFDSRLPSPVPASLLKASEVLEGKLERRKPNDGASLFGSCAPGSRPSAAS